MGYNWDESISLHNLSNQDFERFALNIIEFEAETHKKVIYKENTGFPFLSEFENKRSEFGFVFDAIAPNGIYDSAFTFIEVKKTSQQIDRAVNQIKKIITRYRDISTLSNMAIGNGNNSKLLIVVSSRNVIKEKVLDERNDILIDIWSIEDLIERAKAYPVEYNAFLDLVASHFYNSDAIYSIKSESEYISDEDFKAQNDRLIAELNKSIITNRICLVVGTGVSMDYNNDLSWNALSNRLYERLDYGKRFIDEKKAISILGGDNVSSVEYSKRNLGISYSKVLYNLIYPKKQAYFIGNTSLDECANLINRINKKTIAKVITYNYDDYLEQALKARSCLFHVLYSSSDFLDNSIPIYHVHGFLPEKCSFSERQEYIKTVVLSEEDYFKSYGDSSNWNVAIQLESFKDNVCLFIGNSITDSNEKRLLNKARQEKGKSHFAIIFTKGLESSDLTKIYMHFFYELNVKIIWAKDLRDIPTIISKICR